MYHSDVRRVRKIKRNVGGMMSNQINKRYILNGCSQTGIQWDGSEYEIQHGEVVTCVKKRFFTDNLYRLNSDGRVLAIADSIIKRYFDKISISEKKSR